LPGQRRPRWARPADIRAVSLVPPAAEHAHVEDAVGRRFHSRGPARLQEPARVVEPDVGALNQVAGDLDVVVLEEGYARLFASQLDDLVEERFARLVGRVGLARIEDLDRLHRRREQALEAGAIGEHPRRALVGRGPAAEGAGQAIMIELAWRIR